MTKIPCDRYRERAQSALWFVFDQLSADRPPVAQTQMILVRTGSRS